MNDFASEIDAVLRIPDRELWIVTAAADGRRSGLVATWVMRASLDPADPIVLVALGTGHFTTELVDRSGALGLHLLTPAQLELAWRFGLEAGRDRDKFAGLETITGQTGTPLLGDCRAWLECRVVHRYAAADRLMFWAEVLAAEQPQQGPPLKEQALLAAATPEQAERLRANLRRDVELGREQIAAWRRATGQSPPSR